MSTLRVKNSARFGIVPDAILEDKCLSLGACAVAAWLAGRQDGFEVRVEALRAIFLGISEPVWRRCRRELEAVGWWQTRRERGQDGRMVWRHDFAWLEEMAAAIPHKPTDGGPMHGRRQPYHQELTDKTSPHPPRAVSVHAAGGGGGLSEEEIRERVEAAAWVQGAHLWKPGAFRARVAVRLAATGATPADDADLSAWRLTFLSVAEIKVSQDARAAAEAAETVPPREVGAARARAAVALYKTGQAAENVRQLPEFSSSHAGQPRSPC